MYIKSKQPGVIASYNNPYFQIEFGEGAVKVSDEIGELLIKNPNFYITKDEVLEPVREIDDYEKELRLIKGIGVKTAKDIMNIYKTKEDLIEAVKSENELPLEDNISELLKKKYGGV